MEHLQELRYRLIVSAVAVVIGLAISACFTDDFIRFLIQPAKDQREDFQPIFTEPLGAFVAYFQVSLLGG